MITISEIGLVFATSAIILALALRRAFNDWPYRLRLMLVFDVLEACEFPHRSFDFLEVVLIGPPPAWNARSIRFARTDRCDDVSELVLDRALGKRVPLCAEWLDVAKPLLYIADGHGRAVLQGPTDCFVGPHCDLAGLRLCGPLVSGTQ